MPVQEMNRFQDIEGATDVGPLFASLLSVLKKEVEVYRELERAVENERGVLGKPSLEGLLESNARKETCLLKTKMLEEVRSKVIGRIARRLGLDEEGLRLTTLLPHAGEAEQRDLRACRKTLQAILSRIAAANGRNKAAIDASLYCVRNSIGFMNGILSCGPTYLGSGKLKSDGLNGRICSKRG